jgi:hypothetical protein
VGHLAKRTFAAATTLAAAGASGATLAVMPGTYTDAIEWSSAKTLNVGFVADTVIDLNAVASPHDIGVDALAGTVNLYGPPPGYTCVVKNCGNDGLSATGGTLNTYDIDVDSCFDGMSAHNGAVMRTYRSNVTNCGKDAAAHVGTAQFYHEDCVFEGKNASVNPTVTITGTATGSFKRCTVQPPAGSSAFFISILPTGGGGVLFDQCKLGTYGMTGTWDLTNPALGTDVSFVDCYFNLGATQYIGFQVGTVRPILRRCYGDVSIRLRGGTAVNALVENNVFRVGSAAAGSHALNSDFRDASNIGGSGTFRNNILLDYPAIPIFSTAGNITDINTNWSFQT